MTVKEYLGQLEPYKRKIEIMKNEIEELEWLSDSIKSFNFSTEKVKKSTENSANFTRNVEKIDILKKEMVNLIVAYAEARNTIINQIHELSDVKSIQILYKKYIETKTLETISYEMNYDYDYVRTLHPKALKEFEKMHLVNVA